MNRKNSIVFIMIAALALLCSAAQAQSPKADAEKLMALCEQHCDAFDLIHGNSMYYGGGVDDAQRALDTIAEVEKKVLPEVQPILAVFVENYGTSAMEVSNYFHKAGVELDGNVGNRFDDLHRGVTNVDKSRRASAESILIRVKNDTGYLDRLSPQLKVKKVTQAKQHLLIGHQLDAANAGINDMLATIDAQIQGLTEAVESEIDAAKWAGNVGSFAGPGSPAKLAAAAKDFFSSHPNWTGKAEKKVEVLKVAVRGEWQVAETDIFGRVISWRLPIHLAITDSELKPQKLVRIYELSAVTRNGAPGNNDKKPPFDAYWVGNSWMMRLAKLK